MNESNSLERELIDSNREEIEEIMKYKWCMGEKLGHDPLSTMSMNEIANEWIIKYAGAYRRWRENLQRSMRGNN